MWENGSTEGGIQYYNFCGHVAVGRKAVGDLSCGRGGVCGHATAGREEASEFSCEQVGMFRLAAAGSEEAGDLSFS